MPSDDYAPTVRGGLKLKGAKPTGVEKKKKKKSKAIPSTSATASSSKDAPEDEPASSKSIEKRQKGSEGQGEGDELDREKLLELEDRGGDGKTASERAYEETRRKRLADRLARDGPKTHKQRVEELNKYLSNLSEHHDMPRIGPG